VAPDIQASCKSDYASPIKPADKPNYPPPIEPSEVKPTDTTGLAPLLKVIDFQDHVPPLKETEHKVPESPLYVVEWSRVRNQPPRRWMSVRRLKSVVYPGVEPLAYVGLAILALYLILGPICLVNLSLADIEMRPSAELVNQPEKKGDGMELDAHLLEQHLRERATPKEL
jgi:hypothetical protein